MVVDLDVVLVVGFAVAAAFDDSLRFAVPRAAGFETTVLRAAFCAVVWRGFPFAARRAFPGAAVRVCRDMKIDTNRDDKRVSVRSASLFTVVNEDHQGLDKTRK